LTFIGESFPLTPQDAPVAVLILCAPIT